MLKAPKQQSSYEPVPKGNHVARLYQTIHIGTNSYEYMGEMKKSDKVRLTFELCNEKKVFKEGDEPKPYSISREFGLSMGKKSKLRPFIENMTGTSFTDDEAYGFDIESLIGTACLLNVVHESKGDNTYANIAGATPLLKGMEAPEMHNEPTMIDVNSTPFEVIEALPEFIRSKIQSSEEYQGRLRHQENMEAAGLSDSRKFRPAVVGDAEPIIDKADIPF